MFIHIPVVLFKSWGKKCMISMLRRLLTVFCVCVCLIKWLKVREENAFHLWSFDLLASHRTRVGRWANLLRAHLLTPVAGPFVAPAHGLVTGVSSSTTRQGILLSHQDLTFAKIRLLNTDYLQNGTLPTLSPCDPSHAKKGCHDAFSNVGNQQPLGGETWLQGIAFCDTRVGCPSLRVHEDFPKQKERGKANHHSQPCQSHRAAASFRQVIKPIRVAREDRVHILVLAAIPLQSLQDLL